MTNQEEYIGFNSINQLGPILSKLSPQKIFLVTGRQSFEASGAKRLLAPFLAGYPLMRFVYGEPNPKIEDIESGIEMFRKENPDAVIAVGGGSVIDTAKLISFFASNDLKPQNWFVDKKLNIKEKIPLIAVPTTSGSGSEATHFAVIYLGKEKHSVEHETMLPDISIIDPTLSMTLSPYITAVSGMDALSQAIESYWSIHSTEESKQYARNAIELIFNSIVGATHDPTPAIRLAMAQGAHLAGKAIRITKTTAVHAISYPMTSYFDIPHGHAVGLILSDMYDYIAGVTENDIEDPRGKDYVIKTLEEISMFLGVRRVKKAGKRLGILLNEIGLETNLETLGVKSKEDIETIITHGFDPQRVKNSPRILSRDALRKILNRD